MTDQTQGKQEVHEDAKVIKRSARAVALSMDQFAENADRAPFSRGSGPC